MTEPRKDERKRDRAAYMRGYRKRRAVDRPTLTNLAARVAQLEAIIGKLPHGQSFVINDEIHVTDTASASVVRKGS